MKKVLLLFTLFLVQLGAQTLTLGLGPYMQSQPYKQSDPLLSASPIIFYDNSLVYIRWTRAGIYFAGSKSDDLSWGLSLTAQPRPFGYLAKDSQYLEGMDERKNSLEGGIAFSLQKEKIFFEITAMTDLIYENDAYVIQSELGYELKLADLEIYPSLILGYQSSSFVNYYYGVTQKESRAQRAFYTPKGGYSFAMQSYFYYPLNKKLSLFANLKAQTLPNEAQTSPLVEQNTIYSGLLSLLYKFEY